jgi:hypothetical protein
MTRSQVDTSAQSDPGGGTSRALCGWSPPPLPADTAGKRWVDRVLPRTGLPVISFYVAVVALLMLAPRFPIRAELALDGLAALAAGGWCAANFWRCRHAHCLISGVGWLALSAFVVAEVVLGRSVIKGDEQLVFLGILAAALVFEGAWFFSHGTNAVSLTPAGPRRSG